MKLYKLTTQDFKTRKGESNETLWGEGVTHTAEGKRGLCTNGCLHAYRSPLLAVLLNPAHANLTNPVLWEAEGKDIVEEKADKLGVRKLTTLHRVDLPTITTVQKQHFAILVALEVYKEPKFVKWAKGWLSGADRTYKSAMKAKSDAAADAAAAAYAADAAADAAAAAAAYADAAAYAAYAYAAYATTNAADAAAYAAYAYAADAAAAKTKLTWERLQELAEQAIRDEPTK